MKTVTIIGSTGLVGSRLMSIFEQNNNCSAINSISRSKPSDLPSKATHVPFDSGNYTFPSSTDAAFCALGTTMKKAGSKEAFLKVDLHMVIDFAKKAKQSGVKRFAVVSSIGANPNSSNFYLKTKGQMEEELKKIGFERLIIVRPSLLLGKRSEKRFGEDVGKAIYSILKFTFVGPLRKYRGIDAEDVAKAMISLVSKGQGVVIAESNVLPIFSKEYKE